MYVYATLVLQSKSIEGKTKRTPMKKQTCVKRYAVYNSAIENIIYIGARKKKQKSS